MANICYNTIKISKIKGNKKEILDFFRLDNKDLEEILCEGDNGIRVYSDGFGAAEDEENSVLFEFQSAWGGNPEAPYKLSKIKIFKNCLIHYRASTEGAEDEIEVECINGEESNK
jgi:hypothetical protein